MGKDLRSHKTADQAQKAVEQMDPGKVEQAKKLVNQYAGKDEKELKKQLFTMAKSGKQSGSLNNAQIDGMAQKLSPMLSAKQRKKLSGLIDMLKNQD